MFDTEFQPSHVIKRDGRVRPFDAGKIAAALARAGHGQRRVRRRARRVR